MWCQDTCFHIYVFICVDKRHMHHIHEVMPRYSFSYCGLHIGFHMCWRTSPAAHTSCDAKILVFLFAFSYVLTYVTCITYTMWCQDSQRIRRLCWFAPLTEEIGLKIFGSQDWSVLPAFFWSDGDSVYSRENLSENLGTPEKTCLICMGTPVKTCW